VTKRLLPIPGHGRAEEQTMAMIVALTSEITVLRARLDAFERLAEAKGIVAQAEIDAFEPEASADVARAALRQRTVRRVFRSMREAGAADLAATAA
jgi:hypothetical protein